MTKLLYTRGGFLELSNGEFLEFSGGLLELAEGGDGIEVMPSTLFDLVYRVYRELGLLVEGRATAGSTTTIADTNDRTEANDYWNNGTAFIVYDAGGSNSPPQGEYAVVSDFVSSTSTITLRDGLTTSVSLGDRYAIADGSRIRLERVIQAINNALVDLGPIPLTDLSLSTESEKREYELPLAASRDLRAVYLQLDNTDDDDNQWSRIPNWSIQRNSIGDNDTLLLDFQPIPGYTLKLEFEAIHPEMAVYDHELADSIPPERVVYAAALDVARWFRDKYRIATWNTRVSDLERKHEQARSMRVISAPPRTKPAKLFVVTGEARRYPGDRTPR